MRHWIMAALALSAASPAATQGIPNAAARIEAQREAMQALSFMDGIWRGPAWSLRPDGRNEVIQTERVGPFLDGSVRVVEGRAYGSDGSVAFNALGVISFDPARNHYLMQSWALGFGGTFPLQVSPDGVIVWEAPAGPGAVIRHTATIRDGMWHEIGERITGDDPPIRVSELNLRRVADTQWPAADPVPPR